MPHRECASHCRYRRRELKAGYELAMNRRACVRESFRWCKVQPRLNKSRFKGWPSAVSAGCALRIAPDVSKGNHLTTPPAAQATFPPMGRAPVRRWERTGDRVGPTLELVSHPDVLRAAGPRDLMKSRRMLTVKNFSHILAITVFSAVAPAVAADPSTVDPDLVQFRQAYTTGSGLAYVVIKDEKGDKVYRYGDASRQAAQKDTRGYMLFTCSLPHVFVVQSPPDKAALLKARVVKSGEPEFAELDVKYLTDCKNPLVKSAVPRTK